MEVENVKNSVHQVALRALKANDKNRHEAPAHAQVSRMPVNSPSVTFKKGPSGLNNKFFYYFKSLSHYMKEPSEMTNAEIAAIGTGAIAPVAIMCSPKKKNAEVDPKEDKEKKMFQALRQPVSAALAFGFQVPTTLGFAALFNNLAYEKDVKFFYDDKLGRLIPSKKYLKKQAKDIINGNASGEVIAKWGRLVEMANDFDKYKPELISQLKQDYEELKINISDEELEKLANKKSKKIGFLAEMMARARREQLIDEKVEELKGKLETISDLKDIDLVVEGDQKLARESVFREEFQMLREAANLNWFDKVLEYIGIKNGKLKILDEQIKQLSKEKGLEIIRMDFPDAFNSDDITARLRKFVEARDIKAEKLYSNKLFYITLFTNLFMVGISCVALNALHPKFAALIDKIRGKKPEESCEHKKVEVRA